MRVQRSPVLPFAAGALSVLAGCATAEPPLAGRLVSAAWARPADSGATSGAYLTVINADSIAVDLMSVSSPVATAVEVHETMNHDGLAHMTPRTSVPIAPRDSLVMKPGGVHVMLLQLTRRLSPGDTVPLTLRFSNGDSVRANVPVREN